MSKTKRKSAAQHGREDAQTFANENPELVAGALEPGQPDASEALLSAMGHEWVAKLFGVKPGSSAFSNALYSYSRNYLRELHRIFSDSVEAERD